MFGNNLLRVLLFDITNTFALLYIYIYICVCVCVCVCVCEQYDYPERIIFMSGTDTQAYKRVVTK